MPKLSSRLAAVLCLAIGLFFFITIPANAAEPLVTADWLASRLGSPGLVVLDLRPAAEYRAGHIPGAISADFASTGWMGPAPTGAAGALPPVAQIGATIGALGIGDADHAVVVADAFPAAARVYWTFKVLGHDDVSLLDGSARGWSGPVEPGAVTPRPAVFTPHYNPDLRAELPEVEAAIGGNGTALVDARPMSQWSGAMRAQVVRAGGHLPGAVSLDQSQALTAEGQLKPRNTLALLFMPAGVKPAIVYCNVGYLSATDWFVLSEVLHRPGVKLYDGSMSEWTADPARPVVR